MRARIQEIFSSVQGEGIYVGVPQIFVRFADCNLSCKYCDTPQKGHTQELEAQELLEGICILESQCGPHHSVSITGGEPLLWSEFLKEFLPALKEKSIKVYLETNGTLADKLASILDCVDIIAMDIKLPSSTGEEARWKEHEEFLKIARNKETFVKVVVTGDTNEEDFIKSLEIVKSICGNAVFVIQPATANERAKMPGPDKIYDLRMLARNYLSDIRVIPQVHKVLGVK